MLHHELIKRGPGYEDEAFIYATWLRGLYYGNSWFKKIDKKAFFEKYRQVLDFVLRDSNIDIACLAKDPSVIVAYTVYSGEKLHWCYTKKAWRKLGIQRELIPTDITTCTHLTERAAKILAKGDRKYKFDPIIT